MVLFRNRYITILVDPGVNADSGYISYRPRRLIRIIENFSRICCDRKYSWLYKEKIKGEKRENNFVIYLPSLGNNTDGLRKREFVFSTLGGGTRWMKADERRAISSRTAHQVVALSKKSRIIDSHRLRIADKIENYFFKLINDASARGWFLYTF